MALKFVIAWEAELPGEEHADLSISGLLSGLHKYGAEAFLLPVAYAEEKTLAQILKENGLKPEEGLALVATDASLAQTAGLPIATVAFLHPAFPGRANDLGADVVINSLHKTLPSLTQTAILHINGKLANRRRIKKYLDMLQSSSPSYIFMASLDACVDFLDGKCEEAFELYVERLQKFREELKPLQHLQILRTEHYDISKVVISTANANITSPELADRLRKEYHLEMEMTGGTYVLAMTTVADTQEGLDRLKAALLEIDGQLEAKTAVSESIEISGELPRLEQYFTPQEAADREEDGEAEEIPWKESEGHISLEYAYLYPPGSPVIVPGERISREAVELLCYYETQNLQIEGIQTEGKIKVWKHE